MKPPRSTLHAPRSTPPGGFTILEMLVATGVLAVMVSILFALFAQGSAAWRQGERQSDLNQTARLALDLFTRDAMLAVIDTNQPISGLQPMIGLCVVIRRNPSSGRPSPASDTQYGHYSDIHFVAPTTVGNRATNDAYRPLCGIRYYVAEAKKPNGDRSEMGELIRTIYRSNEKSTSVFSIYGKPWWGGTAPAGTFATNAVLAENVLSFRIQPLKSNATFGLAPADINMFKDLNADKDYTINYDVNDQTRSYRTNPGLIVGLAVVDRRLADRINEVGLKQAAESPNFLVKTNWATVYFGSFGW
ncbi:MAG: type II secretion system protein [Verrucomicrobia bacterium]|nr:type II secretion system protein [Verrucomicrobiota bacterium]